MPEFENGGHAGVVPEGRQEMKVVKMPTREQMTEKLKEGNFLGITLQTDKFYNRFVDTVADSNKVGAGLNVAWELAKYDTLREYPPMIQTIVDMEYDYVIDTVTPDPEVATQAKDIRRKMLEDMRKKQGK